MAISELDTKLRPKLDHVSVVTVHECVIYSFLLLQASRTNNRARDSSFSQLTSNRDGSLNDPPKEGFMPRNSGDWGGTISSFKSCCCCEC
jgi:hypothetical protein